MTSVPALADHLGFWLRMVSNHVSQAFAARLAETDVTVAEWCVLRTLHGRPPLAPSRLADEMALTRGAISKLADRLVAKDLVSRTTDGHDRRAQTLALTAQGARLVPRLAQLADDNDAECFAGLDTADRAHLRRLLERLVADRDIVDTPLA